MSLAREETATGYPYADEPEEGHEPEPEETDDPLAAFPEENREAIGQMIAERERAVRNDLRQNLQQHGLDVTDEGQPALRDAQKLGWLGLQPNAPQAPAAVTPSPPHPLTPSPEEEGEIPDPVMDPAAFRRWHQTSLEKAVKAAVSPLVETLQQARQSSAETAVEIAMAKVPGALVNSRYADLPQHPEFENRMRQALLSVDPEWWRTQKGLRQVAAVLAEDLDGTMPPVKTPPRDEGGRFTAEAGRSVLSRATLPQASPSREAGRQTKGMEPSDVDQAIAARLTEFYGREVTPMEVALNRLDTTGDRAAVERQKRLQAMRGGRR